MIPHPQPSLSGTSPTPLDNICFEASSDLDPQILMTSLGCNLVDHRLMLAMFGLVLSTSLLELDAAMANQDWHEAGEVAEHLKSSARIIGALRLAVVMKQFEHAAMERHTGAMLALHSALPTMVSAFQARQVALH